MERVETLVIGAGVIGLAVAWRLARAGCEVIVAEAGTQIGAETSSRNSEVIHAGLYYPAGSLKARLCRAGRDALYAYCEARAIPCRRLSKLIVAADEGQEAQFDGIRARAAANGVEDLRLLTGAQARALEPELAGTAALLSPSTGIIDSHALMLSLQGEAQEHGAMLAFGAPVLRGEVIDRGIAVEVGGAAPMTLVCRTLVNAAGLGAWRVARGLAGFPAHAVPPRHLAKGNYYALAGRAPFRRLIYPVPEDGGLGVHLTLDLGGQARFGPDVEWLDVEGQGREGQGGPDAPLDYGVDPARAAPFYAAIRRYWPGLRDGALMPAYSGIRPKLSGPGMPAADFLVQGPEAHGIPGLVNLFGIESPGLTSCLALAETVLERLESPAQFLLRATGTGPE
jgi:L-2-hydroxyglutarate oxidase LhgO